MGGGYYHKDVSTAKKAVGSTRSSAGAFDYSRRAKRGFDALRSIALGLRLEPCPFGTLRQLPMTQRIDRSMIRAD